MAGRKTISPQIAGHFHQVHEFDGLVARNARNWRLAQRVAFSERLDHRLFEPFLVIEHIVGNAKGRRYATGIVDVLPGATRSLAERGFAMIVKLKGNTDHLIALTGQKSGND